MTHPDPKDPELQALVERAKQEDPGAYRELLDRYESRALGLARQLGLGREDAQDAVQDAFLKLFRYVHRFRSGESFTNWFYRIVVNASHDQLRRARRAPTVSLEGEAGRRAAEVADPEGDPADPAEAGRLRERVLVALRCLSPQERAAYVLRDLQGLETLQVARALRVTRVTVRRHVSNARRKLRERLEGQFPDLFRED